MAVAKKNSYITAELDWAETKLDEWKQYVDANPIFSLKDRLSFKETKNGGMIPMVVASVESQVKCIRDTTKEMLLLLEVINRLREVQVQEKKTVRGGSERPEAMDEDD